MKNFSFNISEKKVWWNRGIEVKPTYNYFYNKFPFIRVEDKNKFTINWIDEQHINVIIPIIHNEKMIMIWEEGDIPKYYFKIEELNRTRENIECIYQLDIWCTYLISGDIGNIKTTKTLDINRVSWYLPIDKQGFEIDEYVKEEIEIPYTYNNIHPISYLNERINTTNDFSFLVKYHSLQSKNYPINTSIYYVFKTKKTDFSDSSKYFYNLIPLFVLDNYEKNQELSYFYGYVVEDEQEKVWKPTHIINSINVMKSLVENVNKLTSSALGDFVGIWVGPPFSLLSRTVQNFKVNDKKYKTNNLIILGDKKVPELLKMQDELSNLKKYRTQLPDTYLEWRVDTAADPLYAVFGIQVSEHGINFNSIKNNDILKNMRKLNANGLNFLLNENNHLFLFNESFNKIFFNQKFIFTNKKDSTEIDIQLPSSFDSYALQIENQRNSMNTGLKTNLANGVLNASQSFVGSVVGAATGNVGGVVDGIFGIGRSVVQLASTQAKYDAYLKDLRTQTSNTYTNYTDNFVFWQNITYTLNAFFPSNNVWNLTNKIVLSGFKLDGEKLQKFYGYKTTPFLLSEEQIKSNDNYILIDKTTSLELILSLTPKHTIIVRNSIISMLENGVRTVNNPSDLDIRED